MWEIILGQAVKMIPYGQVIFTAIGGLVFVGTVIDKMVPDEYDKGFMGKLMNLKGIGPVLKAMTRFSPFNIKE